MNRALTDALLTFGWGRAELSLSSPVGRQISCRQIPTTLVVLGTRQNALEYRPTNYLWTATTRSTDVGKRRWICLDRAAGRPTEVQLI